MTGEYQSHFPSSWRTVPNIRVSSTFSLSYSSWPWIITPPALGVASDELQHRSLILLVPLVLVTGAGKAHDLTWLNKIYAHKSGLLVGKREAFSGRSLVQRWGLGFLQPFYYHEGTNHNKTNSGMGESITENEVEVWSNHTWSFFYIRMS